MKISKSKGGSSLGKASKAGKAASPAAVDFRHLLQAQMEGVAPLSQTAQTSEVSDRDAVPAKLRLEGVQLAESTIDSLGAFSQALADAELTAADLEPFITALEEESQGLIDINAQLPKDDPLAQLIEEVATACFLETAKFRRGDYQ